MQTSFEKINATFGPETQFDVKTRAGQRQQGMPRPQQEQPPDRFVPVITNPFGRRGVPFSALHD